MHSAVDGLTWLRKQVADVDTDLLRMVMVFAGRQSCRSCVSIFPDATPRAL